MLRQCNFSVSDCHGEAAEAAGADQNAKTATTAAATNLIPADLGSV
jgi:hypothetical protein